MSNKVKRTCENCANRIPGSKRGCVCMTERITTNCFAWADQETKAKRFAAIKRYSFLYTVEKA